MRYLARARTNHHDLRPYRALMPGLCRRLVRDAKELNGLSVVHVNATPQGGGVAELLMHQVPLERSLGLDSRWLTMRAEPAFFEVTKKLHNLLQGARGTLSSAERRRYLSFASRVGEELGRAMERLGSNAFIVLHDPQPLPAMAFLPESVPAIVRLHIDLSVPNRLALDLIRPWLLEADRVVISNRAFRPTWLNQRRTVISYPAINPFEPKNSPLSQKRRERILKLIGVDTTRPYVAQVSRFDPWKDPLGVLEAYYLAKRKVPKLQLVLKGDIAAQDDPEAVRVLKKVRDATAGDPNVLVLSDPTPPRGVAYGEVINAIQSGAEVVVQKSLREGFGLTATEAMWKGKAVVGGNALGVKAQISDGVNGYIVKTTTECTERMVQLIKHPRLAMRLGKQARETVRKNFLFPRLIADFFALYRELR